MAGKTGKIHMALRPVGLLIVFFVAYFGLASLARAQSISENRENMDTYELRGSVGPYPVGLNITVRNNAEFVTAHYFYGSQCINIPVSGKQSGERLTLTEPSGAVMDLHFITNTATPAGTPLSFDTSTGLQGVWKKGATSLPVNLHFTAVYPGVPGEPWYSAISSEPDNVFELHARQFIKGALTGNRAMTAAAISYPLQVWNKTIRSRSELYAQWDQIFTPQYLALLRTAVPHEMVVQNGEAMTANGAVWFNDEGAVFLEVPRRSP